MLKAIFTDFYGTLVYEDGEVIEKISQEIFDNGMVEKKSQIGAYWWQEFQSAFLAAHGESFRTQRELEYQSLAKTIAHFQSTVDAVALSDMMFAYWRRPPIFEESKSFLDAAPVPVYIVSNIDREDILAAVEFHGLKAAGIFTSEDARAYKPRSELFEYALKATGLRTDQVIHIGDSLSSDIKGATALGISTVWVNRSKREIPEGVLSVGDLMEVYHTKFFCPA